MRTMAASHMIPTFTLTHLEAHVAILNHGELNTFHCFFQSHCTHKEETIPVFAILLPWEVILWKRTRWRPASVVANTGHTVSHTLHKRQAAERLLINIHQDEAICHLWHSFWGNPLEFKDGIKNETLSNSLLIRPRLETDICLYISRSRQQSFLHSISSFPIFVYYARPVSGEIKHKNTNWGSEWAITLFYT